MRGLGLGRMRGAFARAGHAWMYMADDDEYMREWTIMWAESCAKLMHRVSFAPSTSSYAEIVLYMRPCWASISR